MTNGFPLLDDLRPGDKLIADGGFTCLREGEVVTVEADAGGEMFVRCAGSHDGSDYGAPVSTSRDECHALDGQAGEHGECVGLRKAD